MITNMVHLWLAGMRQENNILHCSSEEGNREKGDGGGDRRKQLIPLGAQIANTKHMRTFLRYLNYFVADTRNKVNDKNLNFNSSFYRKLLIPDDN